MDCTRFGNKLNYYREKNDMTEKDLARKLHVPVRSVVKWENSEALPNDRVIHRLSEMFGVDFWNYLDLDERHGGKHAFDDEGDLSLFEVLKTNTSGKSAQKQPAQNKVPKTRNQKTKQNRSSDDDVLRKLISKIFLILAAVIFFSGDYILEEVFGLYDLGIILFPLAFLCAVIAAVIVKGKK